MSLAGIGVVAIWHDLAPEAKDEFHKWHKREHMPERVGIPGFCRGRRRFAVNGAHETFAPGLQAHNAGTIESTIYRLEFTRLKTPRSAG